MHYKNILSFLILFSFIIIPVNKFFLKDIPTFRVVLDPGHGGVSKLPKSKHGDRFDSISKKYLDHFKAGASYRGIEEHVIVYSIADKVQKLLYHCSEEGNFSIFREILKKYTDDKIKRIVIITKKSRGKSLTDKEKNTLEDPNAKYRFFDYPDASGQMRRGRLTRINKIKPHLVLSLHLAEVPPNDIKGINPVLAAPYKMLYKGLRYLRGEKKIIKSINKVMLDNWFSQEKDRTPFQWFLSDTSFYFTNYPLNRYNKIEYKKFKGYRYNMIDWAYRDEQGWEEKAKNHEPNSKYSRNYRDIVPEGKFWDREKSKYEEYKRSGGEEGFGGDNAYASYEIIRYILYSLKLHKLYHKSLLPGKPYVGIWIVPLHVNAINPFLELGYLRRKVDRFILTKKQKEIAEGIAVGIYSLLAGMKIKDTKFQYKPKGKKIDLKKYKISNEKSYFDLVDD